DDGPAIINRSETLTYAELRILVARVAGALTTAGVGEEDRVGLLAENSPFWVACYLAIMRIGAIATPFPARLSGEKLRQLSQLTGCRALCLDALRLRQHGAELPTESVVITDADTEDLQLPEHIRLITPAEAPEAPLDVAEMTTPHALAALMFTSGSTGE